MLSQEQTISFPVLYSELSTEEQIKELQKQQNEVTSRTPEEIKKLIIDEKNEKRSSLRESSLIREDDEEEADKESALLKDETEIIPAQGSKLKTTKKTDAYTVKLPVEGNGPITKQELLKILLSANPPPTITSPQGTKLDPNSERYKAILTILAIPRIPLSVEKSEKQFELFLQQCTKDENTDILERYLELLNQKYLNLQAQMEEKLLYTLNREQYWEAILEDSKQRKKRSNIIIAALIVAGLVALAASIVAAIIFPPVGVTLLTFLSGGITIFVNNIISYLKKSEVDQTLNALTNGTLVGTGGLLEKLFGYRKRSAVTKLVKIYNELVPKREAIKSKYINKSEEIKNAKKILAAIKNGATEVKFNSSTITIVIALKHPKARLQSITIENNVTQNEAKLLLEALSNNLTVTKLEFNYTWQTDETTQDIANDIERQRLINCYLSGIHCDEDQVKRLFSGGLKELETLAIKKLERALDSPEIATQTRDYFKQSPLKEIQTIITREANFTPYYTWLTNPTIDICLNAFSLNEKRLQNLISKPVLSKEQIQQIQRVVTEGISEVQKKLSLEQQQKLLKIVFNTSPPENIIFFTNILEKLRSIDEKEIMIELGKYLSISNHEDFKKMLRKKLKDRSTELRNSDNTSEADKLDQILRKDLEDDLRVKHPCLSKTADPTKSIAKELAELKKELSENYDLLSTTFVNENADYSVKTLVRTICQRNLLLINLGKSDWNAFIQVYSTIPINMLQETIEKVDKLKLLQLITKGGIGTYENILSNLTPERRQILLEHCFSLNESPDDAQIKAKLISALLEIPELFNLPDNKTKQTIKQEIYLSLLPFNKKLSQAINTPYHNLHQSRSKLQKALIEIPENDPLYEKITKIIQEHLPPLTLPQPDQHKPYIQFGLG